MVIKADGDDEGDTAEDDGDGAVPDDDVSRLCHSIYTNATF